MKFSRCFHSTHTHVCWLQTLDKVMTQRKSQYHEFRRMIALRAKQYFILMLSHRQYHGSMTFNHQTETLKLTVSLPLAVDVLGLCQVQARSCDVRHYTSCMTLHGWPLAAERIIKFRPHFKRCWVYRSGCFQHNCCNLVSFVGRLTCNMQCLHTCRFI